MRPVCRCIALKFALQGQVCVAWGAVHTEGSYASVEGPATAVLSAGVLKSATDIAAASQVGP